MLITFTIYQSRVGHAKQVNVIENNTTKAGNHGCGTAAYILKYIFKYVYLYKA